MAQQASEPKPRLSRVQVLSRVWQAPHLSNGVSRALFRAWFFSLPVSLASLVALPVVICVDLFLQRPLIPVRLIAALLVLGQPPLIFGPLYHVAEALRRGAWTRTAVRRERPLRYWSWTVLGIFGGVAPLALAAYLTWFVVIPN